MTTSASRRLKYIMYNGGGLCFFSKKNILIPNVAEKNILILVDEKKNNLIQSFCHITNVKFWKNISRLARQKKKKNLILVLSEKKILNETKNHNLKVFQLSQMLTYGLSDLLLLVVGSLVVFVLREYILKVHVLVSSEHKLCQIWKNLYRVLYIAFLNKLLIYFLTKIIIKSQIY